jgi:hypothetical protein
MIFQLIRNFIHRLYEFFRLFIIVLYVKLLVYKNKIFKRNINVINRPNIDRLREM